MSSLAVLLVASLLQADLPVAFALPAPPGPHVGQAAATPAAADGFRSGVPLIATSYFYWYDAGSQAHILDHDGSDALTDHPPTLEGFSYLNPRWHAAQLEDMIAAGIDVVLPVYWGTPLGDYAFSDEGLPQLVAARKQLIAAGQRPPAIGMFYDTTTLQYNRGSYHVDLTTEAGRRWFYGTIRNCFSLIPPADRACINGRPLVFLYASAFARAVDDDLFPAVRAMFQQDFGTDLYLIKMEGWPGEADSRYQWGGALAPQLLETAGIGPGYDHSAVPGRAPLVRPRENGRFYRFSWERLLMRDPATRPWLVHLETWNEFHEGTDICESAEYGRQYLELTRQFADRFRRGERLSASTLAPSRQRLEATPDRSEGLQLIDKADGDGPFAVREVGGQRAWCTMPNQFSPETRYLYFDLEEYSYYDGDGSLTVTVEVFGRGAAAFRIDYDSADPELHGLAQQFRATAAQPVPGSGTWQTVTFELPRARCAGRANGADFRLACSGGDLAVRRVVVELPEAHQQSR